MSELCDPRATREAEMARAQRIMGVGSVVIDVAGGLIGHRSPEYRALHGLLPGVETETHADWIARVVPADRDQAEGALMAVLAGETPRYENEYRIRRPVDGAERWIRVACDVERDGTGRPLRLVGAHLDVTEQKRLEIALRESEERLRLALAVGGLATWDWNIAAGTVTWSAEHYRMQGYKPGEVEPGLDAWLARVHPADRPVAEAAMRNAVANGADFAQTLRYRDPRGTERWVSVRGRVFTDAAGSAQRMIGVAEDVTEAHHAAANGRLLLGELQHRVRNTLAVIRSIARRTADNSEGLDSFRTHFDGRLSAFARTQAHLTRDPGGTVDLEGIVRDELLAYRTHAEGAVTINGPEVRLPPKLADSLGLAIHELATNAIKYGALAQDGGRLAVCWRIDGSALDLDWRETVPGGIATEPDHRGFGSELLERTLAYDVDATVGLHFAPEGVHCTIRVPL